MRQLCGWLFGLTLVVGILGCGGGSGSKVTGKVMVGEKPLTHSEKGNADIFFMVSGDKTKRFAVTFNGQDGTFTTAKPVPPGKYKVAIRVEDPYPSDENKEMFREQFSEGNTSIEVDVKSGEALTINLADYGAKLRK